METPGSGRITLGVVLRFVDVAVDALALVVALRRGPEAAKPLRRMKRRLRVMRTSGSSIDD